MDDFDYSQERMRKKSPFEDGHGIRGPQTEAIPLKQILGTEGKYASYQTNQHVPAEGNPNLGSTSTTGGGSVNLIATINGTAYHVDFTATVGSPV